MGDSPFRKRFRLLFLFIHSKKKKKIVVHVCELDNPISVLFSNLSTIARSSCSCSAKAHQDSRPIGLPLIWSCFPLAKGEGEGELKLGAPLFFGHMHIKMPPTKVQKL
jgi:hypothetical protein